MEFIIKTWAYKGYVGDYTYKNGTYSGKVAGISTLVTFETKRKQELQQKFEDAVDSYLESHRRVNYG